MKRVLTLFITINIFPVLAFCDASMTLPECLDLALQNNLSLKPKQLEIRVQDGLSEQAGRLPNPELEFEVENFLGTGDFQTVEGAEFTLGLSQVIETAGKREKRKALAQHDRTLAQKEWEIARLQILYETADAFIDLLTAQEKWSVQKSFETISQEMYKTIQAIVEAGRDSPLEETRARIMTANTRIALDRSEREIQKAKFHLASRWSSQSPSFDRVAGDLYALPPLPDLPQWIDRLPSHPQIKMAEDAIQRSEGALQLETARSTPDVTLGAGIRYLSESDDGALVVGVSIPLPIYDRNRGAIRAAQETRRKAEAERLSQESEIHSSLLLTYQTLQQNHAEALQIQNEILPGAQLAFETAQEGYRQGKFPYLSVLDAQRTFFEYKIQLIDVMASVHKTMNEFQRLTANYDIPIQDKKE